MAESQAESPVEDRPIDGPMSFEPPNWKPDGGGTQGEDVEDADENLMVDHETREDTRVCFTVGERFNFFDDVELRVKENEKSNYVQLWKRDSRTIQAAQRHMNRFLNEKLKYYEIVFCCSTIHREL